MNDLYFVASKVIGFALEPLHLLTLGILITAACVMMRQMGPARLFAACTTLWVLILGAVPLWNAALFDLETRHPSPRLESSPAGIVVLGGALSPGWITLAHQQVALNDAAERMTTTLALMRRYPEIPVIVSGFSPSFIAPGISESELARQFFAEILGSTDRIQMENRSRNTIENARFSKALMEMSAPGTWLLVTSAAHMPRAAVMFHDLNVKVLPYPTDFRSRNHGDEARWHLLEGAKQASIVMHEWIGLLAYHLMMRGSAASD